MLGQSFRMAFRSIGTNKMRSFLTMLGIIIGIMAVVVLVSIVSSATSSVTDELESMGADKLSVNIMSSRYQPLTLNDVQNLALDNDSIAYTAPTISQSATAKAGDTSESVSVTGVTPDYLTVEQLEIDAGRFFKSPDLENSTAVAVIGPETAEDLFGTTNVVGESVTLDGRSFEIVGVLTESGSSLMGSSDTGIYIPYTVAQRMYLVKGVNSFTVVAASNADVDTAETIVTDTLMAKFDDEDAFNVFNQSSMLESLDSITNTMTLMLGGIAGISLLVGGIGIMNIMLVSVAERTREIGIRKAIGAGRKRILSQFLIEALVLSTLGGLIGLAVSWGILALLSALLGASYTMSPGVAMIAVLFSIAIGLVFGINPANKAAKMPPIEALRTE